VVLVTLGACGTAPSPTPQPIPVVTPSPRPDPHLSDPTTGNLVYSALIAAGLRVVGNAAITSVGGAEPRRRINATFDSWPLIIEEYSTSKALAAATKITPTSTPRPGDPPFAFAGLNIRIEFGPTTEDKIPTNVTEPTATAASDLAAALETIIGPIRQVAVAPVSLPTLAAPAASASPEAAPAGTAPPTP